MKKRIIYYVMFLVVLASLISILTGCSAASNKNSNSEVQKANSTCNEYDDIKEDMKDDSNDGLSIKWKIIILVGVAIVVNLIRKVIEFIYDKVWYL